MTLVTKTRRDTSVAMLWHRRLGHLNKNDLSSLVNVGELEFFEACTASKMHDIEVPKKTDSRASVVGLRSSVSIRDHLKYRVCMVDAMH